MKTMMSTDEFASHIPYGKDKAVTREFLCLLFGMSDRELRRMIQAARNDGHIIINNQSGCGYYRSEDLDDIKTQYLQNRRRALSILVQQKHLRRRLKDAGVEV
nr:MAG TPA: dissimilatory sulfite reductase D [Caudoviricetes sp.]